MTERWAYCVACRRWFYCSPGSARADGSFTCPVCLRPSTQTREGGPGQRGEPQELVTEQTDSRAGPRRMP
jgi:hypothetical protein